MTATTTAPADPPADGPAGPDRPVESASDVAGRMTGPVPGSYADAEAELEQIAGRIEAGEVPIEALVPTVARATELLDWCRATLQGTSRALAQLTAGPPAA